MAHKYLGFSAVGCLICSVFCGFWQAPEQSDSQLSLWLFPAFYGLAFILGFAYGCQEIFKTTANSIGRGLQIVVLLPSMALVAMRIVLVFDGIFGRSNVFLYLLRFLGV
jgi:hypothetical protein